MQNVHEILVSYNTAIYNQPWKIANSFNEYFINISIKLDKLIPQPTISLLK